MPSPAEQQRVYTRLREIFGPQWAEQNWPQFAQLLNDPTVGTSGVDAFIDQARELGGDLGATQFQPKQFGLEEDQRQLPAAEIAEDHPELQQQLIQLANTPRGAALVGGFEPQLEQAAEGGFDETEQAAISRMLEQAQRTADARAEDPERFGLEDRMNRFFDPYTAQSTPPQFDGEQLYNQNLDYMHPEHLQRYYDAATAGAGSADAAGFEPHKERMGDMRAQLDFAEQQAQQVLGDPNASPMEKQQAQAQLEQLSSKAMQVQRGMLTGMEAIGPGSFVDLPALDTEDLSAPEATAGLQMGGFKQMYDPRAMLRGGAGALAARALFNSGALPTQQTGVAGNIQHADEDYGFGTGGYYEAPTREQAVENAWQQIRAQEMETGQELSDAQRSAVVQQYIDTASQAQGGEDERIQEFTRNLASDRPATQAEIMASQMIGRPSAFADQARAMDVGVRRPNAAALNTGRRAVQAHRAANPSMLRRTMQGAGRAASRVPGAQAAGRAGQAVGRAAGRAGGGRFGQVARRIGPMGLATGLGGAAQTGMEQYNLARSGGVSKPWSVGAGAAGTGMEFLGTEAALPAAMRGVGQMGQATGLSSQFGRLGRAMTPNALRGAGGAFTRAMQAGRSTAGPGASLMQRGMTGAKNLATAPGRAFQGARAAFNPAARAQATRAAGMSRGMAGAARAGRLGRFGRVGQFARGAKGLGGGLLLGQMAIDAGMNTGDAAMGVFGGQRGRQMLQQGNRAMANQAAGRGFWGNVAAAPNVVSQSRAMMGLNQQADRTNRAGAGMAQQGAQLGQQQAQRQAFDEAARAAGMDPTEYHQIRREMAGDPAFMDQYLEMDPEARQAHELYQQTQQEQARRRGQAGFGFDEGQQLTDYVQDTGGFFSRAFGGGNEGALRSMEELYQDAPEEMQQSMRDLAQAVESGDIAPEEAVNYLNVGASRDKDELLEQMRAADIL